MFKKSILIIMLIFLFLLIDNSLKAEQPSAEVLKVAEAYAKNFCNGRIDSGVPYYGPGKGDIVWSFTIYKKSDQFPTEEEIQSMVAIAREKRLIAEAELELCQQNNNKQGIIDAQQRISAAYSEMRNEESFATVYVADYQNGYKIIAKVIHRGLPLHYTAYLDAEQRAKDYLNKSILNFERYLYLSPTFIYGGFQTVLA